MTDLAPLLRKSIDRIKSRKALKKARLNLWLAKTELVRAVREVEKTLIDRPMPHELSDIAAISDEWRNS